MSLDKYADQPCTSHRSSRVRRGLRFYCHAGFPGCFCAFRPNDNQEKAAVHWRWAQEPDWFINDPEPSSPDSPSLQEALELARRRFAMIEAEAEALTYHGLHTDEGYLQLLHTIGVMAGIAERGKDEAQGAAAEADRLREALGRIAHGVHDDATYDVLDCALIARNALDGPEGRITMQSGEVPS